MFSYCLGIGILTALAGATEIHLVVTGEYTVLSIGKITTEVIITIAGSTSPVIETDTT
jgi:hypothetical protein